MTHQRACSLICDFHPHGTGERRWHACEPAMPHSLHLPSVGEYRHLYDIAGEDRGILSEKQGVSNCREKQYFLLVLRDRLRIYHCLMQNNCIWPDPHANQGSCFHQLSQAEEEARSRPVCSLKAKPLKPKEGKKRKKLGFSNKWKHALRERWHEKQDVQ